MARIEIGATRYDQISDIITELENSPAPSTTALNMLTSKEVIGQDNLDTIDMVSKTYGYLADKNLTKEKMMEDIKTEISDQATKAMDLAFGPNAAAVNTSLDKLFSAQGKEGVLNWVSSDLLTKEGAGVILGEQNAKPLVETVKSLDETYSTIKDTSLSDIKTQGVKIVTDEITKDMTEEEKTDFNKLIDAPNFGAFKKEALNQIEKAVVADKDLNEAYGIYNMKDPNARNNAIMALAIKTAAGDKAGEFQELAANVANAKTTKDAIGIIGDNILKGYTGVDATQIQEKLREINDWRKNIRDKSTTEAVGDALDFASDNLLDKKQKEYFDSTAQVANIIATMVDKLKEAKVNGAPFLQKVAIVVNALQELMADKETKEYLTPFIETLEEGLGAEATLSTIWDAAKQDPTALANVGILENMGSLVAAAATMNVSNLGFKPLNTTIPGVETIWPMKDELWDSSEQLSFVKSPVLRAMLDLPDIESKTENCSIVMTEDGNLLIKERHTNKVLFQTNTAGCTMLDKNTVQEYEKTVKVNEKEIVKKFKVNTVTHNFNDALTNLFRKNINGKEQLVLQPKPYSFAVIKMDNQMLKYDKYDANDKDKPPVANWLAIDGVGMGFRLDGNFALSFETAGGQGLKTNLDNIGSRFQSFLNDSCFVDSQTQTQHFIQPTEHVAYYNFHLDPVDLANRSRNKIGSETDIEGKDLRSKEKNSNIALAACLEKNGVINIIKYEHSISGDFFSGGKKTLMYSKYLYRIFEGAPGFNYVEPYTLVMNKYYIAIFDANGNLAMVYPFVAGRKTDEQKQKIASEKDKILDEVQDKKDKNKDVNDKTESVTGKKSGKGFDIDEMIRKHDSKAASINIGNNSKKFDWDAAIKRINDDDMSEYHYYDYKGLEKLPANKEFEFDIGVNTRSPLYVEQYQYGQDNADQYAEFNFFAGPFIVNNLRHKITMSTTLPFNIHARAVDEGRMTERYRDTYDIESGAIKNGRKDNIFWSGRSRVGSNASLVYDFRDNQRTWNSYTSSNVFYENKNNFGEFKFEGISGNVPIIKYWTMDFGVSGGGGIGGVLACFPDFRFKIRFVVSGFDVGAKYIGQSPVLSDIVSLRKRLSNGHYFVVNIAKPIIKGGQHGEVTGDLPWDIYQNTYCRIFFTIEDEAGVPVENNFDKEKLNNANNSMINSNIAKDSSEKEVIPNQEK